MVDLQRREPETLGAQLQAVLQIPGSLQKSRMSSPARLKQEENKMLYRTVPELPLPEGKKKKSKVDGGEFAFSGRHNLEGERLGRVAWNGL